MAVQNFRSAFYGFNREDVVRYIEFLNNQYKNQLDQLHNQLQAAKAAPVNTELQAQLTAALEKCAQLEAQLANTATTEQELEAYRRAERAERIAAERVTLLYQQANGALADATVKADETATQVSDLTDQLTIQLQQLQSALATGANVMRDAAAAMYAIRPATHEE